MKTLLKNILITLLIITLPIALVFIINLIIVWASKSVVNVVIFLFVSIALLYDILKK